MSSTYSPDLRIELITTGEQAGVWGVTTNNNLANVIEQAIAGYVSVSITSVDQALTYTNGGASTGAANQSVYAMIALTTALSTSFRVYVPPSSKMYTFYNASTRTATIYNSTSIGNTTAAGTGAIILAGSSLTVWSDGTNVRPQIYNNWDLGTSFPVAAQRYIQITNASTDPAASAAVNAKSDAQNLQLLATSSTASPVSGIPVAGKASLYAAGGAGSSGLQIWDNSAAPQIDFILGAKIISTFSTAGNLDVGSSNNTNTARFIRVKNDSTGSSAYATTTAQSDVQIASLQAYSSTYPAVSGITVAGKASLYATGGAGSSGLQIWDNSAAPQIDFILGSGTVAGTFSNTFNFDVGTGSNTNAVRYLRVKNANTGSSAAASVYSQSDAQIFQLIANSSTRPAVGSIPQAGKSVLYSSGDGTGLQIWDFSTTSQIDFIVGSGTIAGTINSSGNWNFNSKTLSSATWNGAIIDPTYGGTGVNNSSNTLTLSGGSYTLNQSVANGASPTFGTLTAGTFVPTSSSAPTNGMYLYSANTVGLATNSLPSALFSNTGNMIVGEARTLNGTRFIVARNVNTGSSAVATVYSQSDTQFFQLIANSSTVAAIGSIPQASKAVLYSAGGTGLQLWDNYGQIDLIVGTTIAETINSSGAITKPKQPAFTATLSTTQSNVIGNSAIDYKVPFDVVQFDRANNFSGGTFTAPVTGLYRFSMAVEVTVAGATSVSAFLRTTAMGYMFGYDQSASFAGFKNLSGSVLAQMTAGDTAIITVVALGMGSTTGAVRGQASSSIQYTYFSGELVA